MDWTDSEKDKKVQVKVHPISCHEGMEGGVELYI